MACSVLTAQTASQQHLNFSFRETWFCQHSFMFTADHTQVLHICVYFNNNRVCVSVRKYSRAEWVDPPQPISLEVDTFAMVLVSGKELLFKVAIFLLCSTNLKKNQRGGRKHCQPECNAATCQVRFSVRGSSPLSEWKRWTFFFLLQLSCLLHDEVLTATASGQYSLRVCECGKWRTSVNSMRQVEGERLTKYNKLSQNN